MATYSHSRLSTFQQCKLRFKYAYIDKLQTEIETTVEAFLGSRVHEVLEKLYKDLKFQKLNTLPELIEYYNDDWEKNWNDKIEIVRKEYDEENFKKMGVKFITDYYNRNHPFNESKTIGLETEDFVYLDEEKKHKFHIRIDRLGLTADNTYEIHDYKTANSLPSQDYFDKDRQLAIYAYGIKKMYPDAKKIKLIWHYLAFDKQMVSERTDAELEDLRENILKIIGDVETCTEYPARESALCKWCQYQMECPNFKHKFQLEKKTVNEYLSDDGVELVNKFAIATDEAKKKEDEVEQLKEALMIWAKNNSVETVYGSDIRAMIKIYPKLSFPKKDDVNRGMFVETLKKLGLFDKLSTVDVYELAKTINNGDLHPELVKVLENFFTRDKTVRIYLRKIY